MRLKRLRLILAGLIVSSPLFAFAHQNGAYVGLNGGWTAPDESPAPANYSVGTPNLTYGGTVGYQLGLGQKLATGVEANYTQFGQSSYGGNASTGNASGRFENSAVQILLTGTYLMDNGFNTFLKVGAAHEQTGFDLANNTTGVAGWIPAVAAGLGYELIKNVNLYAQYERTFGDDWESANTGTNETPSNPVSLNVLTMGVNYTLPM